MVGRTVQTTIVLIVSVAVTVAFALVAPLGPKASETTNSDGSGVATNTVCPLALVQIVQTIPLPNTYGRIDHMDIDASGHRLFVAPLGNNSVGVISLQTGKLIHSMTGLSQPQGVAFVPGGNLLYVSNAGNGVVDVFDSSSYKIVNNLSLGSDADNMRYDSVANLLYVGYGGGGIAVINATNGERLGSINVGGHPESFQLEKSGARVFVNVPSKSNVVVVLDRKTNSAVATWPLPNLSGNFPMALDEADHRLPVGTRDPAKLVVLDTSSGTVVASLDIPQDPDDVFYNASTGCVYVSSGAGYVTVIKETGPDRYRAVDSVPSSSGARTSLLSPELNQLYVAAPQSGSSQAKILVYQLPGT